MQVFNTYMKVLKSKLGLSIIYIIVFLVIYIAMTAADKSSTMFEQVEMNVCVFDEDNTPESRALCELIAEKNNIIDLKNDRDAIIDALYYERANYVLTIKKGYAGKLAAGDTGDLFESFHMHDSYSAVYMDQFLNEYVSTVNAYMAGGRDSSEAIRSAQAALLREAKVNVANFNNADRSDSFTNIMIYFRFLPYVIISAFMNTLCPVLLAMGKKDIRYRTNCSGIRPGLYTAQIIAGSTVFLCGVWLVFLAAGFVLYGGAMTGGLRLAVLNSFLFSFFAAMLTIFVAGFEPPATMVNVITQVVSLGMSFLCGVFVDQSMLGDGVLAVARFLPAYWYIRVNRMIEGSEPLDTNIVLPALLIEAGFAAVMAILTVLVRKARYTGKSLAAI